MTSNTSKPMTEREAGRVALKELLKPISVRLLVGRTLAALGGVLAIAPYIALVKLGAVFYEAYSTGTEVDTARVTTIVNILIGTFGTRLACIGIALGVTHFADAKFAALVRERTIARVASAPLGWFTSTNAGKVRKALQDDISMVHALVAHQPVDVTQAMVTPVALAVYAFVIDWRLGLLTIATLPIYGLIMAIMMRGMGDKTVQVDNKLAQVSATMVEFVTGITVVKAFGTVGRAHKRYQDAADEFSAFYLDWTIPLLRSNAFANATVTIPLLLAINLGGGAAMAHAGWVEPADVLATSLIALMLPYSIEVLGNTAWTYQTAGAAALRVTQALDIPILETRAGGDAQVDGAADENASGPVIAGSDVAYEDVSFSYGDVLAVDHASFELKEGTVTALVGPSGSGKSTLATLLARFNDPDSGRITLGGVDLKDIPSNELYKHVAFVLQDPQLLRISLRDNIALGKPGASYEECREAARSAHILDVIEALPDGFDTIYGSDQGLSGGQEQRIAIARALLIDAPVLILDEATAFTDPESEAEIQRALSTLVKGRTVLVIAHRPESIVGADRIIVVDRGRVVTSGTHDELLEQPLYRALWQHAPAQEA